MKKNETKIEHVALIPAKAVSTRCVNKNWRPFISDMSLVAYLISIIPEDFFDRVALSTDKTDLEPMSIAGYPVAPTDANDNIKNLAKIVVKKAEVGSLKNFLKNF